MIARHVTVHGRVQGVFFRAETQRTAAGLNIGGWVRNLPDGTVEAQVEGTAENVDTMLKWLEHGPERASVTHLDIAEQTPSGATSFQVL